MNKADKREGRQAPTIGRIPRAQGGRAQRIAKNLLLALLCLGLATWIAELFFRLALGPQNAILLFVLAIFLIAVLTDGYSYCISAAVLGVFAFDFLITLPRLGFSFTIGFPVTLVIMLLVALVTSSITARMKQMARNARESEQRTALLQRVSEVLLSATGFDAVARESNRLVQTHLGRASCLYWTRPEAVYPHGMAGDVDDTVFEAPALRRQVQTMLAQMKVSARWTYRRCCCCRCPWRGRRAASWPSHASRARSRRRSTGLPSCWAAS